MHRAMVIYRIEIFEAKNPFCLFVLISLNVLIPEGYVARASNPLGTENRNASRAVITTWVPEGDAPIGDTK